MASVADIRKSFLDFFASKGHEPVRSSSLVPGNDPTLLFTNAGMVQFKDVFLGDDKRNYSRATSSQRCVRAGGKHNDLENVGYTARHHTFFEMLGNFSFGDYFKEDAIAYAWEYLTEVIKLPEDKLWITVFEEDQEAEDIWLNKVGVSPERFSRIGAKDNFWAMGDTGPCGPCTEIFYDHGEDVAGGPPGTPEEDGDRYIEIWNLVFMQYNRTADGELQPLPKPSVDTGMGLERLAAVLQNVHSNFEIDLFVHLIDAAAKTVGTDDKTHASLKVIADHIRATSFLITDGVMPSNEGRGYVLRRIIRRAIRHGYKLGATDVFFYKLVQPLVEVMGGAYPELTDAQATVEQMLKLEEERFRETLEHGMRIFEQDVAELKDKTIPGEVAFKLYDTYGFPLDLTADIARERGLTIDEAGFDKAMQAQQERSRSGSQFKVDYNASVKLDASSEFNGYDNLTGQSKVVALVKGTEQVDQLNAGDEGLVVLETTPFYAESGGQVGDQGVLSADGVSFVVVDTQKQGGQAIAHIGKVERGSIRTGDTLHAQVNGEKRAATVLNHSATHLMHAALREVLGDHVTQKGSLVDPERLRFDFSHFEPVSDEQIAQIEALVNAQIRNNDGAEVSHMSYDDAVEAGAMALFGEKYGDEVRVVKLGDFSVELCGGCHVERAGDIGLFKIVSESGIASGVRRIEAVTGAGALAVVNETLDRIRKASKSLKTTPDMFDQKLQQLVLRSKEQEKEIEALKGKLAAAAGGDLASSAVEIGGVKCLAAKLEGGDAKALRDTMDQLKNKLGDAIIVLGLAGDGKVNLAAGVAGNAQGKVKAGELVNMVAQQVGGKGGGRPDMAMAGGSQPENLDAALASVQAWVAEKLG